MCISFFRQMLNWDHLAQKKIPAPYKPRIRGELDVSNFAEEFTDMVPTYSPAAVPKTADRVFKVSWTVAVALQTDSSEHGWCSENVLASHLFDPGSIPVLIVLCGLSLLLVLSLLGGCLSSLYICFGLFLLLFHFAN